MRKCRRTCSLPRERPLRARPAGPRESRRQASAHSLDDDTSQPVSPSHDLVDDPADAAGDGRPSLPERLAHREAEALADRLLDHGGGVHLERVHLDGADVVQVREDVDVRVARRVSDGLVVELPALRVVVRHRADERELDVRDAPPSRARYASITPSGSFHGSNRETCVSSGRVDVDPELVDDVRGVLGRQRHVLRRERVDRGRPDERPRSALDAARTRACGRSSRRSADRREQELEHVPVRRREVDVAAPDPVRARVREAVDHRPRLRVVDDDEVVARRRTPARSARCSGGRSPAPRRQPLRIALERVVDRLRDVEELVRAADDPPLAVEAGVCISGTSV